jgi:phosphoglycerate dehydrogenase-like enzyme
MIRLGILASDPLFSVPANRERLERDFAVSDFGDWASYDAETLLEKCRSVEVMLTGRSSPMLPQGLSGDLGYLRYLAHCFGTIKHLCPKSLVDAGLIVTNWGTQAAPRVAEGAMALLLCQLKQVVTLNAMSKGGPDERTWQTFTATLRDCEVGVYGFGPIGREMVRLLTAFGARVAIYDPYAQDVPVDIQRCATLRELFATCRVITIHCGLNEGTRDSVTGELLDLLPQGGIIINTARGAIVDEAALAARVAAGRLLAGVDVLCDERDWTASPLAPLPGAVLSHHEIEWGKGYPPGREPPPELPGHVLENLRRYRAGQPLQHVVTAAEYDLKT